MELTVIDAAGDDREIGRAHARGALGMRPAVAGWVAAAQSAHPLSDPSVRRRVDEAVDAWRELTPATLDQVAGIAEVYDLPVDELVVALLATYLTSGDRAAGARGGDDGATGVLDGCTTVAVSRPAPLLAKNRDNDLRFRGMQTVLRVEPRRGHRWLALSTAGAPGVHSSGMNEVGLCVADTHVASTDIGPGMPRFATMMHMLQECSTTAEAVELVARTPQMGLGTITVVDEHGRAAVVECGYRTTVATPLTPGTGGSAAAAGVGATNHYTRPELAACTITAEDGTPAVSSQARRATIDALLSRDALDREDVQRVLASHIGFDGTHGEVGSVCQHGPTLWSETISTAVFDPVARTMDLCLGRPCSGTFTPVPVVG